MYAVIIAMLVSTVLVAAAAPKEKKAKDTPQTAPTPPVAAPAPAPAPTPVPVPPVPASVFHAEFSPLERDILKRRVRDIPEARVVETPKGKAQPQKGAKQAARGSALPPGWQQKITRGETMPKEVHAQAKPLPAGVLQQLPPPPTGTVLVAIDGKVVRLLEPSLTIMDVFDLTPLRR